MQKFSCTLGHVQKHAFVISIETNNSLHFKNCVNYLHLLSQWLNPNIDHNKLLPSSSTSLRQLHLPLFQASPISR